MINVSVQEAITLQQFQSYMEGYAAGVEAAARQAVQMRISQAQSQARPPNPLGSTLQENE